MGKGAFRPEILDSTEVKCAASAQLILEIPSSVLPAQKFGIVGPKIHGMASDLARSGAPEASWSKKHSSADAAYFNFPDLLESKIILSRSFNA
jgi:hypothetical protein